MANGMSRYQNHLKIIDSVIKSFFVSNFSKIKIARYQNNTKLKDACQNQKHNYL